MSGNVHQDNYDKLKATIKLTDGTNTVDTVKDTLTGRTSLLVSRGHGKNTKTVEFTRSEAATALITPGSDKKIDVCGILTASDSAVGEIQLDFVTSEIKVWRHYISKLASVTATDMHIEGGGEEVLTVTTTQGDQDVFIVVNYRE